MNEHTDRVPERNDGELKAQIDALNLGEREFVRLLADHDIDEVCGYMTELMDYTERLTRAGIAALPDGQYTFTDWNDDDGIGSGPANSHTTATSIRLPSFRDFCFCWCYSGFASSLRIRTRCSSCLRPCFHSAGSTLRSSSV